MDNPYILVSEDNGQELEDSVNNLIKKGYVPHGSLKIIETEPEEGFKVYNFLQPMIYKSYVV